MSPCCFRERVHRLTVYTLFEGTSLLTLWVTSEADTLAFAIMPVVALVAVNFYLHGRYLTERPANPALITAVGLIDLAIITTAVLAWPGGKGIFSPFFVLYFPVIMAFAFVMPRKATVVFTGLTVAAYIGASLFAELARIHRWTGMDGVRAAEGGEGVTGAMIRGLEFG